MGPKIAFPFRHHSTLVCPEAKQMLMDAGFDLVCNNTGKKLSRQAQMDMVQDAFGIVAGTEQYDAQMVAAAKSCQVIVRFGVGLDNFDLAAMQAQGIQVGIIENKNAVAEFVLAIILDLLKKLPRYDAVLRQGNQWPRYPMEELSGKTLGIIGFGRIGIRLVELLQGFSLRILAYDPYVDSQRIRQHKVEPTDLNTLLAQSDIVSLHLPATPETHHFINRETLGKMKVGAYLVNSARGELVDESALIHALETGKLAGAGLDVFEVEPIEPNTPLLSIKQTVLSPHVAALTEETNYNAGIISAKSIISVYHGGRPLYPVF